jgi:hypothetical protein
MFTSTEARPAEGPPDLGTRTRGRSAPARQLASNLRSKGRRAALIATCLVGAGTIALAAPSLASATIDQTSPQWAELGQYAYTGDQASNVTAVYTIENVAEGNSEMLEDNSNAMNNGAATDVWQQRDQAADQPTSASGNEDAQPDNGPITQANYLWEFVPSDPNAGGSIADGTGELINRQSGLCLDVDGSDPKYPGNGTAIDQWTCNGGANQQWGLGRRGSEGLLVSGLNNATDLGVGNGSCNPQGNGDAVYLQQGLPLPSTSCDEWTITPASYDFASYPIQVRRAMSGGGNTDNRGYSCAATTQFRQGFATAPSDSGAADEASGPVGVNTGDSSVTAAWDLNQAAIVNATTTLPGGSMNYLQYSNSEWQTGQETFVCDPSSGTL